MKVSSQEAFEKNLRLSVPNHFAKIYAAIMEDRFERLFFADKLYLFLKHYKPQLTRELIRIETIESFSLSNDLFSSGERFVIIDQLEKLKKGDFQTFIREVEGVDQKTTLLLLSEAFPSDLYQVLKSDLVALDLTDEKPWERKKRHISELMKMALKQKKKIDVAAVDLLIESVGADLARLKSELEKLCIFTEGKESIEVYDVRQMTLPTKEKSYWQMAKDLILEGEAERGRIKDLSDWLIFSGQVRNHLMNMVRISEALERGDVPKIEGMRDKELQFLIEKCRGRRLNDFLQLLDLLFQYELEAKEEGVKGEHLFDMLVIEVNKQVSKV